MIAEVYDLSYWPVTVVPKSELSHTTTAHHGFVPKLSHHGGKTIKTMSYRYTVPSYSMRSLFFSVAKRNGVFSSDDVYSCEATYDEVRACVGACSQTHSHVITTKARRAKDISRGVLYVFVIHQVHSNP